jgi:hypothetical protein
MMLSVDAVESVQPLKRSTPFPANNPHRRIDKPVHAPDTDARVPFRLQTPGSGEVSPDVGLRQMCEQRHTQEIFASDIA